MFRDTPQKYRNSLILTYPPYKLHLHPLPIFQIYSDTYCTSLHLLCNVQTVSCLYSVAKHSPPELDMVVYLPIKIHFYI